MPTERMEEVEVVKEVAQPDSSLPRPLVKVACWCTDETLEPSQECESCSGDGWYYATLFPNSLTAARLRLADAAEAWAAKWLAPVACRDADEWDAMLESAVKLAALRTARGEG